MKSVITRIILTLTFFLSAPTWAGRFDEAFNWIDRTRAGETINLLIHAETNEFVVSRETVNPIDEAAFNALQEKGKSAPRMRFTPEGQVWDIQIDDVTRIELVDRSGGAGTNLLRKKASANLVAKYPIADWGEFLSEGTLHGLSECYEISEKSAQVIHLLFER
jgi:hypothetical protein